jgi:hypothetical protein
MHGAGRTRTYEDRSHLIYSQISLPLEYVAKRADDRIRTGDINHGKVALYQLSYICIVTGAETRYQFPLLVLPAQQEEAVGLDPTRPRRAH